MKQNYFANSSKVQWKNKTTSNLLPNFSEPPVYNVKVAGIWNHTFLETNHSLLMLISFNFEPLVMTLNQLIMINWCQIAKLWMLLKDFFFQEHSQ